MLVYDLIENMLLCRKSARGVVLSTVLWEQHLAEQADDLLADGIDPRDLKFFVEGCPVLHDPSLKPGTAEFITWPENL